MMRPFVSNTVGESTSDGEELSKNEIYNLVSNRRRRFTIHALKRMEEPVEVAELSTYIAAWEMDIKPEEVEYADRRSVYTALRQTHLPIMAEKNIIEFNKSEKNIRSTDILNRISIYTEATHRNEFPWSLYYLGLAGLSISLLLAVITGVPVFNTLGPLSVGAFVAVLFGLSAVVHHIIDRRNRLGATQKPPELRKVK